jgi:hypothetical protein
MSSADRLWAYLWEVGGKMSRFILQEDGTYLDTTTGLYWDAETHGPMTWEDAMEFAKTRGKRLPTVTELTGIVDYSKKKPATGLPNMKASNYWSSTTYASHLVLAWYADFLDGLVSSDYKTDNSHVRCVRGG